MQREPLRSAEAWKRPSHGKNMCLKDRLMRGAGSALSGSGIRIGGEVASYLLDKDGCLVA